MPTLAMLACIVYVALNLGRLVIQEGRLVSQGQILERQRRTEDVRQKELLSEIRDARSAQGVEHLARTALALARPGEVQVVYEPGAKPRVAAYPVPPTPAPTPSSSPGANVATPVPAPADR